MMEGDLLKVLFYSVSCLIVVHGTAQLDGCTSSVCLAQPVTYECSGDTANNRDTLRWDIYSSKNNLVDTTSYSEQQPSVGQDSRRTVATHFETILTSNGTSGLMRSNISFTSELSINNYNVSCDITSTTPDICPIRITDIPPYPAPNDITYIVSSSALNFSWAATTSSCLSHYNVTVTSASTSVTYNTTASDTELLLPLPAPNSTEYSISVAAVDTGGRFMEPQESKTFRPDVPGSVSGLSLTQSYINDTNSTVNVTVSWIQQSQQSTFPRPPIIRHVLDENVTGMANNITVTPPDTTFILNGATVGATYTVGIVAENIMGTGTRTYTSIMIFATSSTQMTSTPTSTPSPSFSGISATPTPPMPSSSSTPTSSSSPLGEIFGIVIGLLVLLIAIIVASVIIGYCIMKNKTDKPREITPQNIEAVNYAQVEHQSMDSSSRSSSSKKQKQAPPKPPKSHDEGVFYSAVQSQAPAQPPPDQMTYADLDHAGSKGSTKGAPKDHARVEYSAVTSLH